LYRYELHLHTAPVSRCAVGTVKETVEFYASMGYDGIFITNHFLDGNIRIDPGVPYKEQLEFYFADYEAAAKEGVRLGIKVFDGVELSYLGTDFLIYGLHKDWYMKHPEIMEMGKREELALLAEHGAYIVHAHPFREAGYIDHIRLYPRSVHAVESTNAARLDSENLMAHLYAEQYGLPELAGSDNHWAGNVKTLAGMECPRPLDSVEDFISAAVNGELRPFIIKLQ